MMLEGALAGLARGAARRPLSPKHGNKNFYKGTRSGRMGHWTRMGNYVLEPWRIRQYIVPDLTDCPLKPYVSPSADDKVRRSHTLVDYFAADPSVSPFIDGAPSLDPALQLNCRKTALETLARMRSAKKSAPIHSHLDFSSDNSSILLK